AMPFPTVVTLPSRPRSARESRNGVRAASSGVRSPNSGIGSSPSPSRHTYRSLFMKIAVWHGRAAGGNPREAWGVGGGWPSRARVTSAAAPTALSVLDDQRELFGIE